MNDNETRGDLVAWRGIDRFWKLTTNEHKYKVLKIIHGNSVQSIFGSESIIEILNALYRLSHKKGRGVHFDENIASCYGWQKK